MGKAFFIGFLGLMASASVAGASVATPAAQLARSAAFSGLTPILLIEASSVTLRARTSQAQSLPLQLPVMDNKFQAPWVKKFQPTGLSVGTQIGPLTSDQHQQQRFVEWNRHAQTAVFETVRPDQMMIRLVGEF